MLREGCRTLAKHRLSFLCYRRCAARDLCCLDFDVHHLLLALSCHGLTPPWVAPFFSQCPRGSQSAGLATPGCLEQGDLKPPLI